MSNVATVSSGWNFQTKSLLRRFVPPLLLQRSLLSLSLLFFFSLSLSFPYILFQRKTGPLLLSLSLQVFKQRKEKRRAWALTCYFSFRFPKYFVHLCVRSVCVCPTFCLLFPLQPNSEEMKFLLYFPHFNLPGKKVKHSRGNL